MLWPSPPNCKALLELLLFFIHATCVGQWIQEHCSASAAYIVRGILDKHLWHIWDLRQALKPSPTLDGVLVERSVSTPWYAWPLLRCNPHHMHLLALLEPLEVNLRARVSHDPNQVLWICRHIRRWGWRVGLWGTAGVNCRLWGVSVCHRQDLCPSPIDAIQSTILRFRWRRHLLLHPNPLALRQKAGHQRVHSPPWSRAKTTRPEEATLDHKGLARLACGRNHLEEPCQDAPLDLCWPDCLLASVVQRHLDGGSSLLARLWPTPCGDFGPWTKGLHAILV